MISQKTNEQSRPRKIVWRTVLAASAALTLAVAIGGGLRLLAQNASSSGPQGAREPSPASQGAPPEPESRQPEIPVPLPRGKKLILKDGSFQLVREYQREGERVRYYSVERSAWEEIPASLVDWEGTEKAEAEQKAQQKALAENTKAVDTAARFADLNVDRSLQVRPGIFLPDAVGFYALDDQTVVNMQQDAATSRVNKGREAERVITGVPFISSKHDIAIPGKQAKIRVHVLDPEFYFRTADGREPNISLLRAELKGDKRELMSVTTDAIGQERYKADEVSLRKWDAAQSVFRYTLDRVLTPGEYAFVESTGEGVALYVWDFGVDAAKRGPAAASGPTANAPATQHPER